MKVDKKLKIKKEEYHSVAEFWASHEDEVKKGDIVISDIDGVWFDGIFHLGTWISRFDPMRLEIIERVLDSDARLVFFTNRGLLGTWPGGYISQLVRRFPSTEIKIFETSKDLLTSWDLGKFSVVKNAQKPSDESMVVMENLLRDFKRVFYIGAQDFSWYYKDGDLIAKIAKRLDRQLLSKLKFIDIRK